MPNELSHLQISINAASQRKSKISRLVTQDSVIQWIEQLELDESLTRELSEMVKQYPNSALPMFQKNIHLMIQRASANVQKELNNEKVCEVKASQESCEEAREESVEVEKYDAQDSAADDENGSAETS